MMGATFPELDTPAPRPSAADEAEARILGFVLRDLSNLDRFPSLTPDTFGNASFGAVFACLQRARAAGRDGMDVLAVAAEIPGVFDPTDLALIEQQADGLTPGRAASLIPLVEKEAQRRQLLAAARALMTARTPAQAAEAMRRQLERIEAVAAGGDADAHPLAAFVDFDTKPKAVRWVIPGVIEHGVVTISGARGVGKTTSILPLAMTAAGLHGTGDPLAPKHWRHVVYIVEHVEQAQRIVGGMVEHGGLGIRPDDVRERLHIVEARRLDPAHVAQVGKLYRERFARVVNGVELLPLVVLDTKAAVLELGNENDNSEASRAMAALKQGFAGLPTWIIGHIAKTQFGRSDIGALSDRGASAFESDAIQNAYLVQDGEQRYLALGKKRFEPKWPELQVISHMAEVTAYDEWGDPETTTLRWGIVSPPDMSRQEARQEAQEAAERERRGEMRQAIMDTVQVACQSGNPLSKSGIKGTVRGFRSPDVAQEVEALLAEGWLHEVEVPSKQRINNAKARFMIKLTAAEHDEFRQSGKLPPSIFEVPASWRKAEIPLGPESEADDAKKTPENQ